jgi:hypothetical protein
MYRTQREYDGLGTLRNVGSEQESGCELHNYQDETMTVALISKFAHHQRPSLMTAISCLL